MATVCVKCQKLGEGIKWGKVRRIKHTRVAGCNAAPMLKAEALAAPVSAAEAPRPAGSSRDSSDPQPPRGARSSFCFAALPQQKFDHQTGVQMCNQNGSEGIDASEGVKM